jgi:hypothetical protein
MKRNQRKENQEIEPLPQILPIKPSTPATRPSTPEIIPLPEKSEPIRPSLPEIKPNQNPEIKQGKKHNKK